MTEKQLTVRELVDAKPTQSDYEEYTDILLGVAKKLFNLRLFRLYLAEEPSKYNLIQLSVNEDLLGKELWSRLIELRLVHRVDLDKIGRLFAKKVSDDFPLGKDIMILSHSEETKNKFNPETGTLEDDTVYFGLTSASDPVELADIKINITFVAKEHEDNFMQKAKEENIDYTVAK